MLPRDISPAPLRTAITAVCSCATIVLMPSTRPLMPSARSRRFPDRLLSGTRCDRSPARAAVTNERTASTVRTWSVTSVANLITLYGLPLAFLIGL